MSWEPFPLLYSEEGCWRVALSFWLFGEILMKHLGLEISFSGILTLKKNSLIVEKIVQVLSPFLLG